MDDKLYNLLNWRDIEGITYSDTDRPGDVLGQHIVKDGLLIQAFVPDATTVKVRNLATNKLKSMEMIDDAGVFAVLLSGKKTIDYTLVATYEDGNTSEFYDAYGFDTGINVDVIKKYNAGIMYDVYDYLGAHPMTIRGVEGVRFAVWAPFALRVSVVGPFNNWDGRKHQMTKVGDTGVFVIFIPGVKSGEMYKYEVKKKGDINQIKYDPMSFMTEKLPGNASVVYDINEYKWNDDSWMNKRKDVNINNSPLNIYELYIDCFEDDKVEEIADYVKNMKYTHVKLMNIIDSKNAPRNYYAPNAAIVTPEQLKKFVDVMHGNDIGVIMDIPMNHFSSEEEGLAVFDGSCLYEHDDMKKGYSPKYNTKLFNYSRPEVSNFLISSTLFWTNVYHMDGINIISAAAMLYLDYDKKPGEWLPNIYGGNENLDAIEMIKHMNSIYKKKVEGGMLIAQDNSGYQNMTGPDVTTECLGFDFKYNEGWRRDLLDYLKYDPYVRTNYYNELTLNYVYTFNDNFILPLTHDVVNDGQPSLLGRMVGATEEKKFANLKLMLGYYMTYPGKKMLFTGNDIVSYEGYTGASFNKEPLAEEKFANVNECVKAMNEVYMSEKAMYEIDNSEEGFEWINNISANENIIVYARKGSKPEDMLVVVCNFDDVDRDDYKIGVPKVGKYKEIFSTDNVKFGGNGFVNPRLKQSKTDECDGRAESIRIKVPALSVSVFKYSKADKKLTTNKAAKASKTTKKGSK